MIEIWKPVVNYVGYYDVSNLGNVRNINREYFDVLGRKRIIKSKNLSPSIWGAGYYTIKLSKDNIKTTFLVHRLVAQTFIVNPNNELCINHIDGNKLNNNINNLEWVSFSENNQHAIDTNLRKSPWIGKTGNKHPLSKPIGQYNKLGVLIKIYVNAREANNITGINYKHISDCCLSKRKTSGGYCWKYLY